MKYFMDHLREWSQQLGAVGVTAIALLFFCTSFYISTILPAKGNLVALSQEVTTTTSLQDSVPTESPDNIESTQSQLAKFYDDFPSAITIPEVLRKIYNAAIDQSLVLDHGDYHLSKEQGFPLIRYEIIMPVKGTYPRIKSFLHQILTDNSTLALDAVTIQRLHISDPFVDTQISLSLYLMDDSQ